MKKIVKVFFVIISALLVAIITAKVILDYLCWKWKEEYGCEDDFKNEHMD